ncbi:cupin domain-containing protein [Herbiconiux moechotypicola]|uniref:Cupin domain-containing protein n=1 Tax=Herbiconiux moechotypicola TaxID=637393 RepID=A0ABP5QEA9_9MICO|nr:cupin domain-containing protein [Herbiconiux moechotypicola]MCS5729567.1 cupin domain-containing protein [Herbiconiux moechotypicola]
MTTADRIHRSLSTELPLEALPAELVMEGEPRTGFLELGAVSGAAYGLWELTAGTARDVEVDEVFVVLSGSCELSIGDGPFVTIGPGDVVTLREGDRTVWRTEAGLRKLYITAPDQAD